MTLLPRAETSADIVFLHGTPSPAETPQGQGPAMSLAAAQWSASGGFATGPTILDRPLTIATLPGGRATGFPRITRQGDDVVIAWTQPASGSTIRLAVITIAPR